MLNFNYLQSAVYNFLLSSEVREIIKFQFYNLNTTAVAERSHKLCNFLMDLCYSFCLQLNIMLHDRRDLSGQRNCLPTQALGLKRENGSLFVMMDR